MVLKTNTEMHSVRMLTVPELMKKHVHSILARGKKRKKET